jgi:hypothetical protein
LYLKLKSYVDVEENVEESVEENVEESLEVDNDMVQQLAAYY